MSYVIYKQPQSKHACTKYNKRIVSSDCKSLPVRFSHTEIVSAWRELPDKERLLVLLVNMRQLGIERTAEIMNKPAAVIISEVRQARILLKKRLLS